MIRRSLIESHLAELDDLAGDTSDEEETDSDFESDIDEDESHCNVKKKNLSNEAIKVTLSQMWGARPAATPLRPNCSPASMRMIKSGAKQQGLHNVKDRVTGGPPSSYCFSSKDIDGGEQRNGNCHNDQRRSNQRSIRSSSQDKTKKIRINNSERHVRTRDRGRTRTQVREYSPSRSQGTRHDTSSSARSRVSRGSSRRRRQNSSASGGHDHASAVASVDGKNSRTTSQKILTMRGRRCDFHGNSSLPKKSSLLLSRSDHEVGCSSFMTVGRGHSEGLSFSSSAVPLSEHSAGPCYSTCGIRSRYIASQKKGDGLSCSEHGTLPTTAGVLTRTKKYHGKNSLHDGQNDTNDRQAQPKNLEKLVEEIKFGLKSTTSISLPLDWYSSCFKLVNEERVKRGSHALVRCPRLDAAAALNSTQMAESCGNSSIKTTNTGHVIRGDSIHSILRTMTSSPRERSNLLDYSFQRIGLGCARGSDNKLYICQLLSSEFALECSYIN